MEKANNGKYVFPLTTLQIGDLQSYLSHLSLFMAPESKKLYILVDNRPWHKDLGPRSAHLWQLMVTKSRLSPFANSKARKQTKETGELHTSPISSTSKSKFRKWFSVIDAVTLSQKKALSPVKKLRNSLILNSKVHRTLYGFIVFEVAWSDVRGMNYLNELQTDTSLAIETKIMKRWEFESIVQATKSISSWFSGNPHEQLRLKEYLDSTVGEVFYDTEEFFPKGKSFDHDENICRDDACVEDQSYYSLDGSFNLYPADMGYGSGMPHTPPPPDGPYKRRKVMKSNSTGEDVHIYPEEQHGQSLDSPLYSHTSYASDCEDAVLKATASRLCGPLLDWIETWDMVSRIKYLGTMLFLHNFEKAVKWVLMLTRAFKSFISVLTQPMAGPLVELLNFILPFWNLCIEILESLFSVVGIVIESLFSLVENLVEIVLMPMWFILSSIWAIAMSIFGMLWEILYAPIRLVIGLSSLLTFIFTCIYDLLQDLWLFASGLINLASNAEATASEVSMWRSLWNDLFSQVFRALRSIVNGVVTFFIACNRHRLSIYNHAQEFIKKLSRQRQRLRPADSRSRQPQRLRPADSRLKRQTCGAQNLAKTSPREFKPSKKES